MLHTDARKKIFSNLPLNILPVPIILFALLLRLWIISVGWPGTNSDEATMGLAALHIAFKGEHPIFFYGQDYMGVMEAYVGAFLFRIFGISVFALRLGLVLLFTYFLIVMYFLAKLLYTRSIALFSVLLLSLGTSEMLFRQLEAVGGYVDILVFGATMLFIAVQLALTYKVDGSRSMVQDRNAFIACLALGVGDFV